MKYAIPHDKRVRLRFWFKELQYIHVRAIFCNQRLPLKFRLHVHRRLGYDFRPYSFTHARNRCLLTGRGRGVYRDFGLARFQFKELAALGYLTGVQLASW